MAKFGIQLMPRLLMPAYQVLMSQDRIGHWGAVRMRAAGPKLTRERFAPYMAHLATRDPLVLFKAMESMRDHSAADVLPEIDVPFLILAGDKDSLTPPLAQERMHGLAPTSELNSPTLNINHVLDLAQNFFSKTRWRRTFMLIHGYPVK